VYTPYSPCMSTPLQALYVLNYFSLLLGYTECYCQVCSIRNFTIFSASSPGTFYALWMLPKRVCVGAHPRTRLRELTALPRPPSWWEGASGPLPKHPTPLSAAASHFGFSDHKLRPCSCRGFILHVSGGSTTLV